MIKSKAATASVAKTATTNVGDDIDAQIAALQAKKREYALAEIGGDFDTVKSEIAGTYAALVKKADALKLAYNDGDKKYYAPWDIQGKRPDWPIRDYLLDQGKPQTVAQIADGVDYDTNVESIKAVLDKDQKNGRKLFVAVGDKWWVAGKSQAN